MSKVLTSKKGGGGIFFGGQKLFHFIKAIKNFIKNSKLYILKIDL